MKRFVFGLILVSVLIAGCGPKYIKGTKIPNTPQAKEIWRLVEVYRKAVEHRDIKTLAAMLSRRYYENAGTTDTASDDYGYEGVVKRVFPLLQDNVKAIQYKIHVYRIKVGKDKASAEFEYWAKVLIDVGGHKKWIFKDDFDRLDFVKEDGVWRIVRGM